MLSSEIPSEVSVYMCKMQQIHNRMKQNELKMQHDCLSCLFNNQTHVK